MNLEMKNIFVTGGSGFLGSHILYKLAIEGYEPIAIKRKKSNLENVQKLFSKNNQEDLFNNIKWMNCDLEDFLSLEKCLQTIDVVFHCAGFVSFNKKDKNTIYETNYIGTKNLINLCLKKSVSKFCHVSSISTLSNNGSKLIDENDWFTFSGKKSHYAISKYLGEMEVWRGFSEGLKGFIINPSLIIGPGDQNSLFGKMIPKIKNNTFFYPQGGTGFVDVRDVAGIIITLAKNNINHQRYIINSENLSFKKLLFLFAKITNGRKPTVKINNNIIGLFIIINKLINPYNNLNLSMIDFFNSNSKYCNQKIQAELNYKFIPIKKSISDIIYL